MTVRAALELLRTDAHKLLELLSGSLRAEGISEANVAAVESIVLDISVRFAHLRSSWVEENPGSALADPGGAAELNGAVLIQRRDDTARVTIKVPVDSNASDDAAILTLALSGLAEAMSTQREDSGSAAVGRDADPETVAPEALPATPVAGAAGWND